MPGRSSKAGARGRSARRRGAEAAPTSPSTSIMAGFAPWQHRTTRDDAKEHEEWLRGLRGWPLTPISYLDCLVFCLFLAAGLIKQIGLYETTWTTLQMLPFLLFRLPLSYLWARLSLVDKDAPPFSQASFFEDIVLRCVKYAFANVDYRVGRVFFSKDVAAKFYRYRLASRGWLSSPTPIEEKKEDEFQGVWIRREGNTEPDLVVYYIHGGGFVMGSPWFYLEFLQMFLVQLVREGFSNPAIFALDYTLVPDATFPIQLRQVVRGYEEVLSFAKDANNVVLSGDSAGATLGLSLLLHLARPFQDVRALAPRRGLPTPGMAAFISPWVTLQSARYAPAASDYLDVNTLRMYAAMYAENRQGLATAKSDALLSPGTCTDLAWLGDACPSRGMLVTYSAAEVFAPEIEAWLENLSKTGAEIKANRCCQVPHAWPVASVFLGSSDETRVSGLRHICQWLRARPSTKANIPAELL